MKPTEDEINDVLEKCIYNEEKGQTFWPGMTYEQGVKATLEWMEGYGENPLND